MDVVICSAVPLCPHRRTSQIMKRQIGHTGRAAGVGPRHSRQLLTEATAYMSLCYAGRTGIFVFDKAFVTCSSRFKCTFKSSGGVKANH